MARGERYVLGRRSALDGLRALAVLGVVVAHCRNDDAWGTGQSGVTLFFVLSGFLITRLLVEEQAASGRVDLRRFWARRGRRLLPALALLLAVVGGLMLAAGMDLWPVAIGGLYVANFAKLLGLNLGLLEHLWTLSMEEQFYAVWPVVVVAVRRLRVPLAGLLGASVVVVSAWLLALVAGGAAPDRVLMAPDTRVIDLLWGCLLACVLGHLPRRLFPPLAVAMTAIALAIPGPFYGPATMLPVALAATGLVAWGATAERGWAWRVVTAAPLRGLGRISYGVYLWNFPVARLAAPYLSSWALFAVTLAVPVALAFLSWRYVEQPLMRRGGQRREVGAPSAALQRMETPA